jgi:hypothetical protein
MTGWRAAFFSTFSYSVVVAPTNVVGDCAHTVQTYQEAKATGDDCNRVADLPVTTDEEYALGGAVAIRIVGKNGLIVEDA